VLADGPLGDWSAPYSVIAAGCRCYDATTGLAALAHLRERQQFKHLHRSEVCAGAHRRP
jgi:hypothetical protein